MRILRESTLPGDSYTSLGSVYTGGGTSTDLDRGESWKASAYNIIKRFDDGSAILYNTASDAILGVAADEVSAILSEDDSISPDASLDMIHLLRSLEIVVPSWIDEDVRLAVVRNKAIYDTGGELKVAINPTLSCNARCEYCFEAGAQSGEMSAETLDRTASFIASAVPDDGLITFRWFGGEPLLVPEKISAITESVAKRMPDGARYKSTVLTNATRVNEEILNLMAGLWHTTEVHLTLDGPREEHNRIRHYLSAGLDGYQLTLDAARSILEKGIAVVCRINVSTHNEERFEEVVSEFDDMPRTAPLRVYPAPTRPHTIVSEEYSVQYQRYNEMYASTMGVLRRHGFFPSIKDFMPIRKVTCCSTRATNELVVDYDGQLYKCMQVATRHQSPVGDIDRGVIMNAELAKWVNPPSYEECEGCVFFPICQGGCQGFRSLGSQIISPCVNERWYMDALLELVHDDFLRTGDEDR